MKTQIQYGKVDATDYPQSAKECKCRVKLDDKKPGILTKPLPVLQTFAGVDKSYCMPKVGDRVAVILDEHAEEGVVLGAIYTKQIPPPVVDANLHRTQFEDGSFGEYDKENQKLIIEVGEGTGAIEVRANEGITIKFLGKGDVLLESLGKVTFASKEALNIYSDATILVDAKQGTTIVPLPNPRPPYFPGQADPWLQE